MKNPVKQKYGWLLKTAMLAATLFYPSQPGMAKENDRYPRSSFSLYQKVGILSYNIKSIKSVLPAGDIEFNGKLGALDGGFIRTWGKRYSLYGEYQVGLFATMTSDNVCELNSYGGTLGFQYRFLIKNGFSTSLNLGVSGNAIRASIYNTKTTYPTLNSVQLLNVVPLGKFGLECQYTTERNLFLSLSANYGMPLSQTDWRTSGGNEQVNYSSDLSNWSVAFGIGCRLSHHKE